MPENQQRVAGDELYHPARCLVPVSNLTGERALRLRVPDRIVEFMDRVQGLQASNLARTVGDFVLRRRDGLYAYQLAVVVDDATQGITDVVRGADLLASTSRQVLLRETLGLPAVTYMHVPLAVDAGGLKLSKSEAAPGLAVAGPAAQAVAALEFLRQEPPPGLSRGTVTDVWGWAASNWHPERCTGETARRVPEQA